MENVNLTIEDLMTQDQLKLVLEFAEIYRLLEGVRQWNTVGDEVIFRAAVWMKRHKEAEDLTFWPLNQIDVSKHMKRGKTFINEYFEMMKDVDEDVTTFLEHAQDHIDSVNDVITAKLALEENKLKAEAAKTLFGGHLYNTSRYGRAFDYEEMISDAEEELEVNINVYNHDLKELTDLLIKHKPQ